MNLYWVLKKKQHNLGLPTFKLPTRTCTKHIKTNTLNGIFDDIPQGHNFISTACLWSTDIFNYLRIRVIKLLPTFTEGQRQICTLIITGKRLNKHLYLLVTFIFERNEWLLTYTLKRISNCPLYKIRYYATYLTSSKSWLLCKVHTNLSINRTKETFPCT